MCKIFYIMNTTKQHKQMQLFAKCNFLRGECIMMKKLNNDVLQFDNIDEYFNYSLKTYVDLFENEFDVNIIELFCNIYNEIKIVHKNILHIILYDDCFCICENENDKIVAHLYSCDENDFYYINRACCNNYDEFLKINDLHYIE